MVAPAEQDMSRDHFREAGYWLDKTVDQLLTEAAASTPGKVAVVADRADRDQARLFTYRELEDLAERAASSLRKLGLGPGDVVTVQLPNWWEFVVAAFACSKIGAIMNPVMPILRERELLYILNFCEAKVFIVPKVYRGFNYSAMAEGMRGELPYLKHLIVVDGENDSSFERALLATEPVGKSADPRPDDMSVLMFTSGTTGEPKGVIHTSNSLIGCTKALTERFGLDASDVLLVASPVGHMTGYAAIVLLSVYLGGTMVLQDVWEPKHGVSLMAREGVTYTAASTPFLSDICDVVKAGAPSPASLRSFLCGGAPIPSVLIERAASELGIKVCSLWGMTEVLAATLTEPSRASDKSPTTDGRPLEGMEVRIVDFDGKPVPTGQSGRLLVRGCQMFTGYYKKSELKTFDAEGWFDSGDLAYMDGEGYIRISGQRCADQGRRERSGGGDRKSSLQASGRCCGCGCRLPRCPSGRTRLRLYRTEAGQYDRSPDDASLPRRMQDGQAVLARACGTGGGFAAHRERQDSEVQTQGGCSGVRRRQIARRPP